MDENEQLQTFAFPGRSSEGFRVKTLYDTGERLGILINPVKSQNIPTSFSVQAVFPLCCVFGSDAAALDEKAIPQDKSSCLLTVCLASLRTPYSPNLQHFSGLTLRGDGLSFVPTIACQFRLSAQTSSWP